MGKAKVEATPTIRAETALTPQAAAGESVRPDAYVQAPQGLFPAPLPPSERAAGAPRHTASMEITYEHLTSGIAANVMTWFRLACALPC